MVVSAPLADSSKEISRSYRRSEPRCGPARLRPPAEHAAETEDVAEPPEDVFEPGEDGRIEAGAAAKARVAKAVVHAPLVLVSQDGIRLGGFLELVLGFLAAWIAVGVVLQGQLAIGSS